ncbi:MAG: hypothetical protein BWY04_01540 [candidate division CPR1 bacterium ADurb.Bin160]|uniref:Uncharacterized protein n=1 Tax=candidate division CPR1 bacterium ADurb.Bin160 TaxID=1852826 RepID=A0A1V5ZHM6_9BACT|nr:MAG: hypothetical protein BWY04_01540 [candidate division CPR1 bacterium ADurb.Bin160]
MKARIKINYAEATKGQIFEVVEINGKRVTVNINGRNVDFGFSEVQIVSLTTSDIFNLGSELLMMGSKPLQGWRENDVNNFIAQINLPITKSLMRKSINHFIWG